MTIKNLIMIKNAKQLVKELNIKHFEVYTALKELILNSDKMKLVVQEVLKSDLNVQHQKCKETTYYIDRLLSDFPAIVVKSNNINTIFVIDPVHLFDEKSSDADPADDMLFEPLYEDIFYMIYLQSLDGRYHGNIYKSVQSDYGINLKFEIYKNKDEMVTKFYDNTAMSCLDSVTKTASDNEKLLFSTSPCIDFKCQNNTKIHINLDVYKARIDLNVEREYTEYEKGAKLQDRANNITPYTFNSFKDFVDEVVKTDEQVHFLADLMTNGLTTVGFGNYKIQIDHKFDSPEKPYLINYTYGEDMDKISSMGVINPNKWLSILFDDYRKEGRTKSVYDESVEDCFYYGIQGNNNIMGFYKRTDSPGLQITVDFFFKLGESNFVCSKYKGSTTDYNRAVAGEIYTNNNYLGSFCDIAEPSPLKHNTITNNPFLDIKVPCYYDKELNKLTRCLILRYYLNKNILEVVRISKDEFFV